MADKIVKGKDGRLYGGKGTKGGGRTMPVAASNPAKQVIITKTSIEVSTELAYLENSLKRLNEEPSSEMKAIVLHNLEDAAAIVISKKDSFSAEAVSLAEELKAEMLRDMTTQADFRDEEELRARGLTRKRVPLEDTEDGKVLSPKVYQFIEAVKGDLS